MKSLLDNPFKINTNDFDKVVVSLSGGKDSYACALWAVSHFPIEKIVCVHASIDIDWNETRQVCIDQCDQLGLPLVFVKAVDNKGKEIGFLDVLTRGKTKRNGEKVENLFPDRGQFRWCTSTLKTGPINKFIRTLKGNVLSIVGERKAESGKRKARLIKDGYLKFEASLSTKKDRLVTVCHPIADYTDGQVWALNHLNNAIVHPCYAWGLSRASCALCIYSNKKEIELAKKHAPNIVEDYLNAEKKISHTFGYRAATKTRAAINYTVADILSGNIENDLNANESR